MEQPTTKLAQINKAKADNLLMDKKHKEVLNSSTKVSSTVLSATASLVKYLEGHISKTEVVNQLTSIDTPDVFEVVTAINNLHETLKSHKNTDLSEVTAVMQSILDEAKLIPKTLPKEQEQKFVDYSDQLTNLKKAVDSVGEFIKEQKLVAEAPIINVDSPTVNVDAPDLAPLQTSLKSVVDAVKLIVIPEFKTDNKALEKLVKTSNKLLKAILDKPVSSGGGGGGGRATPYQDNAGIPAFVELVNGKVPIDVTGQGIATATNQDQQTQLLDAIVMAIRALQASSPSLQVTDNLQRLRVVVDSIAGSSLGQGVATGMTMGVPATLPLLSTGTTYFQGVYMVGQSWQQNTADLQNISYSQMTDRISIV